MGLRRNGRGTDNACSHQVWVPNIAVFVSLLLSWSCHSADQVCSASAPLADLGLGCGGVEVLKNPGFIETDSGWDKFSWKPGGLRTKQRDDGLTVEVDQRAKAEKYDALIYQNVQVEADNPSIFSLCVRGTSSHAGDTLRFAVDGGSTLGYQTIGGGARTLLELQSNNATAGCFNFKTSGTALNGRVVVEVGDVQGQVVLCEATLRQCNLTQGSARLQQMVGTLTSPNLMEKAEDIVWETPACPATVEPLSGFSCSGVDLSDELLSNPGFIGKITEGSWDAHIWKENAAVFDIGPRGTRVQVTESNQPAALYDVGLNREVVLDTSDLSQYELCVQAGASTDGIQLRFAVDSGPPFFTVPGMQERHMMDLQAGKLSTSCFRFVLDKEKHNYTGRIAIEMGKSLGQLSLCQVSLKRCRLRDSIDGAMDAVRRCYVAPLQEVERGCQKSAAFTGKEFGLNLMGQDTSGKQACLSSLRKFGGNTFTFSDGRCELWNCPDRQALFASAVRDGNAHVYSNQCEYQENVAGKKGLTRRVPVFVKLWEWNFKDIAKECEDYLGPNGFDAVQVAPVVDHILNGSWNAKYQPVSFMLNSRSGSADEFKCMVATCRAHGVEVLVDVVLNHMARPCDAVGHVGNGAVTPCKGWGGSRFGNRRLAAQASWDAKGPVDFHHDESNWLTNCGVDKNFQCPDSTPPGDCTQCDLFGLPDWDTSATGVQEMLRKHLKELHDIGVTMLRLDAASYMNSKDLATILNDIPWDFIFQEWWAGVPSPSRSRYVGHYRDVFFGRKLNKALVLDDAAKLPDLLEIHEGLGGLSPQKVIYPLTFHDQRSYRYEPGTPTYKGGLEFHQQQKFLLAGPHGHLIRLWGGYGWSNLDDGPPGCPHTVARCTVVPVHDELNGQTRCMATPSQTPLDGRVADVSRWICEHRWHGVAGLISFRKHCQGLEVTQKWIDNVTHGNLAWRAGQKCFVALQKKVKSGFGSDWNLAGIRTGLPEGRYCDLASLPTQKGWDGKTCPREVLLGPGGIVTRGSVPQGDLLAIHANGFSELTMADPSSSRTSKNYHFACHGQVRVSTSESRRGVALTMFWIIVACAVPSLR